ncbi:MAG TPA: M48 family metalloprotease [Tepidisphaeraceae bacterium]|jgi:predicted Zn-dependent protease|nr:M48 family metalloprotease [Tepidisphaeraceae bacterium]
MVIFAIAGVGCSAQHEPSGPTSAPSVAPPRYGLAAERAVVALGRLRPVYSGQAAVHVSPSIIPTACSWSDGTICLSTGLLRILDDDEIAAAIAHELGHLTGGPGDRPQQTHALGGGSYEDREQQADAIAVVILRRSGISPTVLARVLTIVRDAPQTRAELRPAITQRIALLPKE